MIQCTLLNYKKENNMVKINQYVSIIDERNIIACGKYKVGKNISSGEYYIWGNDIRYSYKRETIDYSFNNQGDCYAVFETGDSVEFEKGKMTPVENIVYMQKYDTNILIPGHVYRIGSEIPIGYYIYKFDEKYFEEEEVFLVRNECGVDIYDANSDSRFYRERGEFGSVKIMNDKRHVVIKNGMAKYYGENKFDAQTFITNETVVSNVFWEEGKTLFENEIINLKLFLKHNKASRFCGKIVMNLLYYYWYSVNEICTWTAKVQPLLGYKISTIEMIFQAEGCSAFHKKFAELKDIRRCFDKGKEYYVLNTILPKDFYGKKLTIILKSVDENFVEETMEDFDDIGLSITEVRKYYAKEFSTLENLLNKVGGLRVDEELKYFEEAPDLIEKIIPAIEDIIKATVDMPNKKYDNCEITFKISATYNKAFYCMAKLADDAKLVRSLDNDMAFEVVYNSTQLREIELTNYILYDSPFVKQDEYIRNFLQERSCRYYIISRMQQCMAEMNEAYGYSSKITNSVLLRIIKNENRKLRREVDKIYSDIVKENRVPTRWGNEYRLFSLINSHNADTVYQYHCDWLGQQSLDIYIETAKIGIEYQGEQHYKAVDMWGGEESLKTNKERDLRKKQLCRENGVRLLEWFYQIPVNNENVIKFMKENDVPFVKSESELKIKDSIMAPIIETKKKKARVKKEKISKYIVVQYDMIGKYIEQYLNIGIAAEKVGVSATSISKVLRGERNSAAGYIWKKFDKEIEIPLIVDVNFDISKTNLGMAKKVILLDKDGNVKQEFASISEAAQITGVSVHHIQDELTNISSVEWRYSKNN